MPTTDSGVVRIPTNHSVDAIVAKLKEVLCAKGITLFALVDHSGEAEKVGLHMPNTKLLIFGSPKAGTPLMVAAPSIALDLPLKIVVYEGSDSKVWLSYNSPEFLQQRHDLPQELTSGLRAVEQLASAAAS